MNKSLRLIIEKIEGKSSASDRFNELTKNKGVLSISFKSYPKSWIKIFFKSYPRLDSIIFSKTTPKNCLEKLLIRRRSVRSFSKDPVSLEELSRILYFSAGIINSVKTLDNTRRPYPSAGARYPLEIYLISLNTKGLKKGLYHYNIKRDSLEFLLEKDLMDWVLKFTGNDVSLKNASLLIVVTAVLDRTRVKYGDRGYRYILLEAGHLSQNLSLTATSLNLGSYQIGGFIDDEYDKLLDIDKRKEKTLYLTAIGRKTNEL